MEVLRRLRLRQNKKKEKKKKAWGLYMRNTGHTPEPGIGLSMSAGGRDLYSSFRLGMGDMNDTEKHINDMVYTLGRGGFGFDWRWWGTACSYCFSFYGLYHLHDTIQGWKSLWVQRT